MSFTVSYSYEAIDRFTPTLKKIKKITESVEKTIKKASGTIKNMGVSSVLAFKKMKENISRLDRASSVGFRRMSNSIKRSTNALKDFGNKAKDVGRDLMFKVSLPILAMGGYFIKTASDAQEANSKFATVFKDVSKQADAVAKNLKNNYGLSSKESKQLLSDTGDLLTGFGFSGKSALDLSEKVNKLAVDLASFTNLQGGSARASQAITKALIGERESIKLLGIAILEEDVKRQVSIEHKMGLRFATLRQAKANATLTLAINQSKNAMGDFARTSEDFENKSKVFKARIKDLSESFGNLLLPMATKIVDKLTVMAEKFEKLSPGMKKTILVIGGIAAILPPIIFGFGLLAASISAIMGLMGTSGLTAALTAASLKFGGFMGMISAAGASIGALIVPVTAAILIFGGLFTGLAEGLAPIMPELKIVGNFIKDVLVESIKILAHWLGKVFEGWKLIGNLVGTGISKFALGEEEYKLRTQVPGYKPNSARGLIANSKNQSSVDINMNLNAPKGVVKSIASKTGGSVPIGMNMMGMGGMGY